MTYSDITSGVTSKACCCMMQGVSLAARDVKSLLRRAQCHMALQDFDKAIVDATTALQSDANNDKVTDEYNTTFHQLLLHR